MKILNSDNMKKCYCCSNEFNEDDLYELNLKMEFKSEKVLLCAQCCMSLAYIALYSYFFKPPVIAFSGKTDYKMNVTVCELCDKEIKDDDIRILQTRDGFCTPYCRDCLVLMALCYLEPIFKRHYE